MMGDRLVMQEYPAPIIESAEEYQQRQGHDAKLLGATEAARPVIAAVSIDDAMEGLQRQRSMTCANSILPRYIATPRW